MALIAISWIPFYEVWGWTIKGTQTGGPDASVQKPQLNHLTRLNATPSALNKRGIFLDSQPRE
eukprot:1840874-Amphidinium_carterae.1